MTWEIFVILYWIGMMVSSAAYVWRNPKPYLRVDDWVIGLWVTAILWPVSLPIQLGIMLANRLKEPPQ